MSIVDWCQSDEDQIRYREMQRELDQHTELEERLLNEYETIKNGEHAKLDEVRHVYVYVYVCAWSYDSNLNMQYNEYIIRIGIVNVMYLLFTNSIPFVRIVQ